QNQSAHRVVPVRGVGQPCLGVHAHGSPPDHGHGRSDGRGQDRVLRHHPNDLVTPRAATPRHTTHGCPPIRRISRGSGRSQMSRWLQSAKTRLVMSRPADKRGDRSTATPYPAGLLLHRERPHQQRLLRDVAILCVSGGPPGTWNASGGSTALCSSASGSSYCTTPTRHREIEALG